MDFCSLLVEMAATCTASARRWSSSVVAGWMRPSQQRTAAAPDAWSGCSQRRTRPWLCVRRGGRGSGRFHMVRSERHKQGICHSLESVGSVFLDDPNVGMGPGDRTDPCRSTSWQKSNTPLDLNLSSVTLQIASRRVSVDHQTPLSYELTFLYFMTQLNFLAEGHGRPPYVALKEKIYKALPCCYCMSYVSKLRVVVCSF